MMPVARLVPLDYRYALDAAMSVLNNSTLAIVQCNLPQLEQEVHYRVQVGQTTGMAHAGLWIEPLVSTWKAELQMLRTRLHHKAPLIIITSRPGARLLPERRLWTNEALGFEWRGIMQLCRALADHGWTSTTQYGIHTPTAIVLNMLGAKATQLGRPDIGDRMHFASRLRYCTTGPLSRLSTVALLISTKEQS